MKSILEKINSEEVAKLNRTLVQKQLKKSSERKRQKDKSFFREKKHCYICEELSNNRYKNSHNTVDCSRRKKNKKA